MRTIAAVTVGRSDFGIYLPVLRQIEADPELRLQLIVAAAHLSPEFGLTINEVIAQGFQVDYQVPMLLSGDSPEQIAKSTGLGVMGFSGAYAALHPDILLVIGDRFEMLAAVLAAVPFKIPIAHIHGGEVTHGAMDDAFRHSITKCSHLHFATTVEHARRIVQLGEHPQRVFVSGAPGLDNLNAMELLDREELSRRLGIPLETPPLLVTYHPETLRYEQTAANIDELLAALEAIPLPIVFTKPNADTNGRIVTERIAAFVKRRGDSWLFDNLGTQTYFSLMRCAAAMVGNSSSGIIEAASFKLPVVNVGIRQQGRPCSGNVVHVPNDRQAIASAVSAVLGEEFRGRMSNLVNIYGDGRAAETIVNQLKRVRLDDELLIKQFHDIAETDSITVTEPLAA